VSGEPGPTSGSVSGPGFGLEVALLQMGLGPAAGELLTVEPLGVTVGMDEDRGVAAAVLIMGCGQGLGTVAHRRGATTTGLASGRLPAHVVSPSSVASRVRTRACRARIWRACASTTLCIAACAAVRSSSCRCTRSTAPVADVPAAAGRPTVLGRASSAAAAAAGCRAPVLAAGRG